ncbi:MAG: TetR/AcrR family transcriptional regulator [Leptolyngbya sp. SIOISBB]|nr:TetR/AcrR family transcriptional regulator [Leptolyngbya sp. SIOISBB]
MKNSDSNKRPRTYRRSIKTRQHLIQSAIQILIEQGNDALTLDAVTRVAEISKGGLLYHFPNKEALVVGIIQHLIDTFNQEIEVELEKESGNEPGKWLRAYIRATFHSAQVPFALLAGIFAAYSTSLSSESMQQIEAQVESWRQQIYNCGLDLVQANLVYLASEGLWSTEMLGTNFDDPSIREKTLERLIEMTYESKGE